MGELLYNNYYREDGDELRPRGGGGGRGVPLLATEDPVSDMSSN